MNPDVRRLMLARTRVHQAIEELTALCCPPSRRRQELEYPLYDWLELTGAWVAEIEREEMRQVSEPRRECVPNATVASYDPKMVAKMDEAEE